MLNVAVALNLTPCGALLQGLTPSALQEYLAKVDVRREEVRTSRLLPALPPPRLPTHPPPPDTQLALLTVLAAAPSCRCC